MQGTDVFAGGCMGRSNNRAITPCTKSQVCVQNNENNSIRLKARLGITAKLYSRHRLTLHDFCSTLSPSQENPPLLGFGWSQIRDLICTPSPQVAEHACHAPHTDHEPLTAGTKVKNKI